MKRILKQLTDLGVKIEDLIASHLARIFEAFKNEIKTSPLVEQDLQDALADDVPIKVFISVPRMWTPSANKVINDAAQKAGIKRVELVWEPVCAAAHYNHIIKDKPPAGHDTGLGIIVLDLGGGTGDVQLLRYGDSAKNGATVLLYIQTLTKGVHESKSNVLCQYG